MKLIIALAARCRFTHQRLNRAGIFQYAVEAVEGQEASLIVLCVTLNQPFQRHVSDATNDKAVKIAEVGKFCTSRDIRNSLVNDIRHLQNSSRCASDNVR